MGKKTIEQVFQEHTDEWMSVPGVVGTGIGVCDGEPCIRIFVTRMTRGLLQKLPSETDGYVVDVVESGKFRAREPYACEPAEVVRGDRSLPRFTPRAREASAAS
jgi:hypothetical protein